MFKDAVAETVTGDVRCVAATRQQSRRPEVAAFFIANVKGFAVRITHRIVRPWRQAEFVRIFTPRVGRAALRDDGSKRTVRYHIHPRSRRHMIACGRNDVLAAVGCETAKTVEENQVTW